MILTAIDDHHGFRLFENLQKTYLKKENINIRLNVKIIGSYAFYVKYICSVMCSIVDHLASWSIYNLYKVNLEGSGIITEV